MGKTREPPKRVTECTLTIDFEKSLKRKVTTMAIYSNTGAPFRTKKQASTAMESVCAKLRASLEKLDYALQSDEVLRLREVLADVEEFKKRGFKTAREYVIFRLANSEKAIYDSGLYGKAFEIEVRAYISGKGVYYVHTANRSDLRTKVFGATPEEVEIKIACGELNATLRKGCKWVIYCPDFDIRYPAKDQGHVMTREEWLDFMSSYDGKGQFLRLDKKTGEYHIQSFYVSEHKRPGASKRITKYIYNYLDYVPTLAELIGR